MSRRVRRWLQSMYEDSLTEEIATVPTHVAIIQDGNRRYARQKGGHASDGHREGAKTTEQVLEWCQELGVKELTVYAFSTENFNRPENEKEALFDLLCEKLYEFADADRIHDNEVCIRGIGDLDRLPKRVQSAINYAEQRTQDYNRFTLNIALAYGGRFQLLKTAQEIAEDVNKGPLKPTEIDIELIEERLYNEPVRNVDLIIRTGGDHRTSNFLPWYANGNEAAVFFCTPYWPEFSKADFLRGIRTYASREESWQRTRVQRAAALLDSISDSELPKAQSIVDQFWDSLPIAEQSQVDQSTTRTR